jgi:Uma2 family endonuclease
MPTHRSTLLGPEVIPDTSLLTTEDGKPVDNLFVEKQYRLLTEPLWTSWKPPRNRPFRVLANVGLFFKYPDPPLVPDVMFALDVASPRSARENDSRSYFIWVVGKPPDIVIEIVSDKRGGEDSRKLKAYERIRVPFYVIFDPNERLEGGPLRAFGLSQEKYKPINPKRFGELGLGLKLWDGEFEGADDTWLRWLDADGELVPNAAERAASEKARAVKARRQAKKEKTRADEARKQAEEEKARADEARKRVKRLEDKLRSAGLSPNGDED